MSINVHIQNIDSNWILHWIFRSWNPCTSAWLLLSQRVWCNSSKRGTKQLWIQISNAIIPKITHQTTKPQLLPFHFLPPNCCFQYHCRFHGSLKQRCQKRQSLYPGRHVFTCTDAGIEGNHLMLGQVHKEWMWNWNYNIHIIYCVKYVITLHIRSMSIVSMFFNRQYVQRLGWWFEPFRFETFSCRVGWTFGGCVFVDITWVAPVPRDFFG